ncbi:unnamed protein product [Ambrosiozyma monospora]|uniref:Unnamed protein product n=1 Tax=Ambrosiozyma monospora TaxID=43982 RepID=A0ACB5SU29_AMBMO|nr:unnamed protein product [Ambrosiozyma monospora]
MSPIEKTSQTEEIIDTPDVAVAEDDQNESNAGLTLPIARIKRIIKLDPEHVSSTEAANYMLGLATELFVTTLTEKASLVTKANKRKKVMYDDFHNAVVHDDNLLFLKDLIPKKKKIGELAEKGTINLTDNDIKRFNLKYSRPKRPTTASAVIASKDVASGGGDTTAEEGDISADKSTSKTDDTQEEAAKDDDDNATVDLEKEKETETTVTRPAAIEPAPTSEKRKPKLGRPRKNKHTTVLPKGQHTLPFAKAGPSKKSKASEVVDVTDNEEEDVEMKDA